MAKVKIGACEPTINSVKITVPDEKKNFNIDDGCIDNLCKGLEALLSEYKAEL